MLVLIAISCAQNAKYKKTEKTPVDVMFKMETIQRLAFAGDNWCMTWAADDTKITSMCDGDWLGLGKGYHNHLYRIIGGADSFTREDITTYPDFSGMEGSWFGYGVIAVDSTIYSVISKTPGTRWSGPFRGIKLLKSPDNGKSWYRVDKDGNELRLTVNDSLRNRVDSVEMFFLEENGVKHKEQDAYPFSYISFVQNGQNNSAAKDDYIYMYSPEGAYANKLNLARVNKKNIGIRSEWQYFSGYDKFNNPSWDHEIDNRKSVHEFPDRSSKGQVFGWYSWLPSVVWNEGLGLYIMVNGGAYGGAGMTDSDMDYYSAWMHSETGSLGFWYSPTPYGPWREFFYTEYWIVDDEENRTYQPKLSPKWMSKDGTEMTLIWSDAMKNKEGKSHTVNYMWNQMKINIVVD